MTTNDRVTRHGRWAKALHWGVLLLFAIGLIRQVDELEELDDRAFLIEEFAFAAVFLFVLILRFIYMRRKAVHQTGQSPQKMLKHVDRFTHLSMYLSLTTLVLSGLAIGVLYLWFSSASFVLGAALWLHEASYWASVNLIVIHILIAVHHRRRRDGVWDSMVPLFKEKA